MKKVYITGIGPGAYEDMTLRAHNALQESEVIGGYRVYTDIVRQYYPDKEYLSTGMGREQDRCKACFETAASGRTTALVCSGDAGVYGLTALMYGMAPEYPDVELEVIPGVSAAMSGGALAGAPLTGDFACISLSDVLTPWELIEERLRAAAASKMPICLYNPGSKGRPRHLQKACSILAEVLPPHTVCAIAEYIGRDGEACRILDLEELSRTPIHMFATVFIGSEKTENIGGRMVTKRV